MLFISPKGSILKPFHSQGFMSRAKNSCGEEMQKGYIDEFWNGVHLEEEIKKDLEINGSKK